jgi:SRSO17 transposase
MYLGSRAITGSDHGQQKPLIAGEAKDIAAELSDQAWHRLSAGHGTKGERLYDWAYLPLADLDAEEFDCSSPGLWTRGLLIRRNIADGDLAYFTTWCPKGTTMQELVNVEGTRWRIEECFETAKNEFGLDHNETRSWAWLASACLSGHAGLCRHGKCPVSGKLIENRKKTQRRTRQSLSAGPFRKSGASS